jgi:DNA-binding LacI/PurR family transcriptional regulator
MQQAFQLSLDLSRNLSVVGFDDIRLAQFMIPLLTMVQMSQTEIAETAFTALFECVDCERTRSSRKVAVIRTNLMHRSSTTLAPHRRIEKGAGAHHAVSNEPGQKRRSPLISA